MRALVEGRRAGSLGVVLGLFALLCLLASSLGLTLAYRAQLKDLKSTIYTRCLQRQHYDLANHNGQVANAEVWKALADIAAEAKLPPTADGQTRRLYAEQVRAINTAKVKAQAAAAQGVIGSCESYR